jgi:hypothetical protein
MQNPLDQCIKKFVAIEAGGIRYFGTLVEVGEEEAILRTPNRWISVPIEKIASIKEVDPVVLEQVNIEEVDADEYVLEGEPEAGGEEEES